MKINVDKYSILLFVLMAMCSTNCRSQVVEQNYHDVFIRYVEPKIPGLFIEKDVYGVADMKMLVEVRFKRDSSVYLSDFIPLEKLSVLPQYSSEVQKDSLWKSCEESIRIASSQWKVKYIKNRSPSDICILYLIFSFKANISTNGGCATAAYFETVSK